MKRKPKKVDPSLDADLRSLAGLWLLEGDPRSPPKILFIHEGSLDIHDFGADFGHRPTFLGIRPEERDGQRFLLDSGEGTVLCSYRLDGDRLELEDRPRPEFWALDHPDKGELTGTWLRLRTAADAAPGTS